MMVVTNKFNVKSFRNFGNKFSKYCKGKDKEFFLVDSDNFYLFDLNLQNIKKKSFNVSDLSDICYCQEKDIILCSSKNNVVCKTSDDQTVIFETPLTLDLNLMSVASHKDGNLICSGAELKKSLFERNEYDALLIFWDMRNPSIPVGYYKDSHSDNIVSLSFNHEFLLSGSEDGLINLYDIRQTSEDEALLITLNSSDTVNKCGWLLENDLIYCFTGSEKFLLWNKIDDNCNLMTNLNFLNSKYRFLADCDESNTGEITTLSLTENSSSLLIDSLTSHYEIYIPNEILNNACFINQTNAVVAFSDNDLFICY